MVVSKSAGRPVLGRLVLVVNRAWFPVHVTTVRRSICMVYRGVAYVVATDTLQTHGFEDWVGLAEPPAEHWIQTPSIPIPVPEVVQLRHYDKVPRHVAPFTRRNLYRRDGHTCQYCGRQESSERLSIDHINPKSRGGLTSWENCVLACVRCNAGKADRPLGQSGLRLIRKPRRPHWSPLLNLSHEARLGSWRRFTSEGQWDVFDGGRATGS